MARIQTIPGVQMAATPSLGPEMDGRGDMAFGAAISQAGAAIASLGGVAADYAQRQQVFAAKKQALVDEGRLSLERTIRGGVEADIQRHIDSTPADPEKWGVYAEKAWAGYRQSVGERAKKEQWTPELIARVTADNIQGIGRFNNVLSIEQNKAQILKANEQIGLEAETYSRAGNYQLAAEAVGRMNLTDAAKAERIKKTVSSGMWWQYNQRISSLDGKPLAEQRAEFVNMEAELVPSKGGNVKIDAGGGREVEAGLDRNTRTQLLSLVRDGKERAGRKQESVMRGIAHTWMRAPDAGEAELAAAVQRGDLDEYAVAVFKGEVLPSAQAVERPAQEAKAAAEAQRKEKVRTESTIAIEKRISAGGAGVPTQAELDAAYQSGELSARDFTRFTTNIDAISSGRSIPTAQPLDLKSEADVIKWVNTYTTMEPDAKDKVTHERRLAVLGAITRMSEPAEVKARLIASVVDAAEVDLRDFSGGGFFQKPAQRFNGRPIDADEAKARTGIYKAWQGVKTAVPAARLGGAWAAELLRQCEAELNAHFTAEDYDASKPDVKKRTVEIEEKYKRLIQLNAAGQILRDTY